MSADPELKRELDATLRTRKDLGPDYDDALVDSFLEKVDRRLDELVDTRVRRGLAEQRMTAVRDDRQGRPSGGPGLSGPHAAFGLAVISLVLAIPLSAVAGTHAGLPGVLLTWLGIVGVNAVHAGERLPWARSRGGD